MLENGTLTALKLRKMVSNKLKEGKGQPDTGQAVIYIPTATIANLESRFAVLKNLNVNNKADFLKLDDAKKKKHSWLCTSTIMYLQEALKLYRKLESSISEIEKATGGAPDSSEKKEEDAVQLTNSLPANCADVGAVGKTPQSDEINPVQSIILHSEYDCFPVRESNKYT